MVDTSFTPEDSLNWKNKDNKNSQYNSSEKSEILKLNHEFFTHVEGEKSTPLEQLLKEARIFPDEILPPPPVCLQLVNDRGEAATIGTLGNFSAIIGKAKSRKSFFVCLIVSALILCGIILKRVKGMLPANQRVVLYFDTEQSRYHVLKALKRICKLTGISYPDNLQVYGLRKYTPRERLKFIEDVIYSTENVGLVVIDGIRDLINSINDEAEATMIVSKLLKWTEEKNIHIVIVIHQNKGDSNARGHIGSEITNKAETVLSVTKSPENKDISIVMAEYCRDKEPEPFAFEIDEFGLPCITSNWQMKTAKKTSDVGFDEFMGEELYEVIEMCFAKNQQIGYSELVNQIILAFKTKMKRKLGENMAKQLLTFCKNRDWVLQEKPKGKYTLGKWEPDF